MATGSLQEKNGKWHCVIAYTDVNGKKLSKWRATGLRVKDDTKRKANSILKDVIDEFCILEETYPPVEANHKKTAVEETTLFAEWITKFLNNKRLDIRGTTEEGYESIVSNHVLPYFTGTAITLGEIRPHHIKEYVNTKRKEGLSITTIKQHLVIVRGALQMAVDDEVLQYNPGYRLKLPKAKKYTGNFYSQHQANELLSVINGDPLESAIVLGLYYGLRRSECLGLRWQDIDFTEGTISIKNTVTRLKTVIEAEQTKSETSRRTIALNEDTLAYLKRLKQRQGEDKKLLGEAYTESGKVCRWQDGRPFTPGYVSQHFKALLEKRKLPHIRFHDLRHSAGSLLLNSGISIKHLQELLGHGQVSITLDLYAHLYAESKKETAEAMAKILNLRAV